MNLTEPQAGSDVGALRTRAEPNGDGTYAITGQKIFITWGDNDLAANVCHLVLARLPDGGAGHARASACSWCRSSSPMPQGNPGARNSLQVVSLEHKLGLHGCPTCVMQYRRGDGLAGGRAAQGHGGDVHHDEQRPPWRRRAGRRRGRGGAAAGAGLCRATASRARRPAGQPAPSSTMPTCAGCWPTMKAEIFAARAIALSCAVAIDMARATGERRLAGAGGAADPDRQGLRHRYRLRGGASWACRCMAAWASSRRPARRSSCAMCGSRRSTKAPTAFRRWTLSAARWRTGARPPSA